MRRRAARWNLYGMRFELDLRIELYRANGHHRRTGGGRSSRTELRPVTLETTAFFCDLGCDRRGRMEMERQEKDGEHQENADPALRARILPERGRTHYSL